MGIIEILLISISLAMDASAASFAKGLSVSKAHQIKNIIIALYFGIFQAIMPILGYFLGNSFGPLITKIDHYIILILLLIIGISMIKESFNKDEQYDYEISFKSMIALAVATSIDAFAVGITFSFLKVNIISSCLIIGIITFILSFISVNIGIKLKNKCGNFTPIIGGLILIFIGIKIFLEHLNII